MSPSSLLLISHQGVRSSCGVWERKRLQPCAPELDEASEKTEVKEIKGSVERQLIVKCIKGLENMSKERKKVEKWKQSGQQGWRSQHRAGGRDSFYIQNISVSPLQCLCHCLDTPTVLERCHDNRHRQRCITLRNIFPWMITHQHCLWLHYSWFVLNLGWEPTSCFFIYLYECIQLFIFSTLH